MEKKSIRIPIKNTSGSRIYQGVSRPEALSTSCPYCSSQGIFALSDSTGSALGSVWPTIGKCPGCMEAVSFVFYYDGKNKTGGIRVPEDCTMFPAPSHPELSESVPLALPEGVARALKDTEATFKAGMYSPSVTSGRRAMEGMFKSLSPESERGKKLYDLIEQVCKSDDALKPLKDLSHAIRAGGNLGAHFDLEKEADEETARAVLELLHYLASYFFLLPKKIDELETKLRSDK